MCAFHQYLWGWTWLSVKRKKGFALQTGNWREKVGSRMELGCGNGDEKAEVSESWAVWSTPSHIPIKSEVPTMYFEWCIAAADFSSVPKDKISQNCCFSWTVKKLKVLRLVFVANPGFCWQQCCRASSLSPSSKTPGLCQDLICKIHPLHN